VARWLAGAARWGNDGGHGGTVEVMDLMVVVVEGKLGGERERNNK